MLGRAWDATLRVYADLRCRKRKKDEVLEKKLGGGLRIVGEEDE